MKNLAASPITPQEWYRVSQFQLELQKIKGPCISLYFPHDTAQQTIKLLENTKRSEKIEKIESAIQKRIHELKNKQGKTRGFANTFCIFGWIANGKVVLQDIAISKKLPYVYMLSKKPFLKPFRDILKTNYSVILVIMDQKSAKISHLIGNELIDERRISIDLKGRHKKGGQSQGRFLRARQTHIHRFYKKVAKKLSELDSNAELIFLAGSGNAKTNFHGELDDGLVPKCRFIEDVSFSTAPGDLHKKIIAALYNFRRRNMTRLLQRFETLVKDGLTLKKNPTILRALQIGAVDTLLVSANYHRKSQFANILKMLELAAQTGAKVEFVAAPHLVEKLDLHDSALAILRYKIK